MSAQDTEAIRAAITHFGTWAQVETSDHAPNCPGCKADAALGRLVARLEAAERAPQSDGCRTCHRPWTECEC